MKFTALLIALGFSLQAGQNAAPSSHLVFDDNFPGDILINEVRVPKAGEAFDEDGAPREDADRWAQYADRGVAQLEWWATAAREHRSKVDPTTGSPAFTASPSQRNAP